MKKKNIRHGKVLWLVCSVAGGVSKFVVDSLKEYSFSESRTSTFAHGTSFYLSSGFILHDDSFSLCDYNVSGGGYNNHKVFFTPSAAFKYAEKWKDNLPAIDIHDYFDSYY